MKQAKISDFFLFAFFIVELTGCTSLLPSGVYPSNRTGTLGTFRGEYLVSNKSYEDRKDPDARFGVFNTSSEQWVVPMKYKRAAMIGKRSFNTPKQYAVKLDDNTWRVIGGKETYSIKENLDEFECAYLSDYCFAKDAEGREYFYNRVKGFALISGGRKWTKVKEGLYKTPAKNKGLYYYRKGYEFVDPPENQIGTVINYDLGAGNKADKVTPIFIHKYYVDGKVLWGIGDDDFKGPVCKSLELYVYPAQPADGDAKRANYLCSHVDGTYVSISKFNIRGYSKFLEDGRVVQWYKDKDKSKVLAQSEDYWDTAIAYDQKNVAQKAKVAAEKRAADKAYQAKIDAYVAQLTKFNSSYGIDTLGPKCPRGLTQYACRDAVNTAKIIVNKRNSAGSWKNMRRGTRKSYASPKSSGYNSGSRFNRPNSNYNMKRDYDKFRQTMDYINGSSTYNPNESYRYNR